MTGELAAFFLFLLSGAGLYILLRKKIPVLLEFPREDGRDMKYYAMRVTARIQRGRLQEDIFSLNIVAQKILSRIHILALRTESKTNKWLEDLRRQARGQKNKFSEGYWTQIKKKKKDDEGGEE